MQDATVHCGCGRTMFLDARRGRGAFRCGCGVTIRVDDTRPDRKRCVGLGHGSQICRIPPVEFDPLPLCEEHYAQTGLKQYHEWCSISLEDIALEVEVLRTKAYERFKNEEQPEVMNRIEFAAWRRTEACRNFDSYARQQQQRAERDARNEDAERLGTIYFIRINDLIKIGKTFNLAERLASFSYPDITVLATEPGYTIREGQLHGQFRRFRRRGEWFHAEQPLLDYIAMLPKGRTRKQAA